MKLIKKRKGFTLIEVLISMAITFSMLGATTSFMFYFSKISNRNVIKNTIHEELRVLKSRIEKEMLPANKILYTDSTITTLTTGKDVVILQAPVINKLGFYVTDAEGKPEIDKMVIYTTNDGGKLNLRSTSTNHNRLKFTLKRSMFSDRNTDLTDQVLYSKLMPVDTTSKLYNYPSIITSGDPLGVFTYYKADGSEFTTPPASQADCNLVAIVRVTLWSEDEYSGFTLAEKETIDITIRNYEGS